MDQPFPVPTNRAQLHDALIKLRNDGVPAAMRAAIWRTAYRDYGSGDEHGMHLVAYDTGLGGLTGEDWRYPKDISVYEPSHHGDDLHGLRDSQYYRGYQISVAINKHGDAQWSCHVGVMDSNYRRPFSTDWGTHLSLAAAFKSGMERGKSEVGLLISGHAVPQGRSAEGKILRGQSD